MDYTRYKEILSNFSKKEIEELFDFDVYQAIKEWTGSDSVFSETVLIKILISIEGYNLFKNSEFRKSFFEALNKDDLEKILPNEKGLTYKELAKKASSVKYANNEMYNNLFRHILKCDDFEFYENNKEQANEIIEQSTNKFFELLDYQYVIEQQVLFELNKKRNIGRKILVHMPTGTGKTKTTMHIVTNYINFIAEDNTKIIWIADRNELLSQAVDTFKNVWSHLGRKSILINKSWGINSKPENAKIIFTSIQTLVKMKKDNPAKFEKYIKDIGLIVFDECHKVGAKEYKRVVEDISKSTEDRRRDFIGLTATPGRTTDKSFDNVAFKEFFDRIIKINCDLIESINKSKIEAANAKKYKDDEIITYFQNRGILAKIKKEELEYITDKELIKEIEKEYRSNREDYSEKTIKKVAENRSRNSAIINKLKYLNSNKIPTIVFACSLNHAKLLSAFLNIENIPNSLVFGAMNETDRKRAIDKFKNINDETNIIINYDILTTGFDATNIDCVFITRPTKSVILYSQMIGRGLRGPMMGGNPCCNLIDLKDNLSVYNENEAFSHFKFYWR